MARAKHVAVLMGGWSAEREVSVNSGRACAEALEQQRHRVTRIDGGRDIATLLQTLKPDVALNVLHGRPGEDGTLQGILEILAIPYTHSGVLASALAMRKDVAKTVFRAAGIPVPDGMVVPRAEAAQRHVLPAAISPIVYLEVRRLAVAAHRALGCRGVSRADFRYDGSTEGTGGLVCLEVNTQPGMTETSLVPELAAHAGISFSELVRWMVEDASLNR